MAGVPVRDPFPYDMHIAGTGVMLARPKPGSPLVATRPQTLDQVAPTDYNYGAQSPIDERIQPWEDFSFGFGQKIQAQWNDRRSRYALGVDTSIEGKLMLGPLVTSVTPGTVDSTNGVQDFFEIGGSLYYLNGRYVQKRTDDATFAVNKDFGAGNAGLTARLFRSTASSTNLIFVAMGSATPANDWYFDGTTWTQMATFQSLDFIAVGREFYRASDVNLVSKVDTNANPTVEANWTAPEQFRVGDKSSAIVRFGVTATGVLLIFKTDGIYSLDQAGQDIKYYPFLSLNANAGSDNAKNVGYFGNDVYVQYDGALWKVTPEFALQPIGPERIAGNDSPVRGYVSAFLGTTNNGFGGLYNPDTGDSYLMKFGAWKQSHFGITGQDVPSVQPTLSEAWNGSVTTAFSGKKITAMWQSTVGAASGHKRAWIGFSDGGYGYFTLSCVPDPSGCTSYVFTTTGKLYPPLWHGTFLGEPKTLRSLIVTGPNLGPTRYATFAYKTDPSASSYTAFGTNFDTTPHERADFPNNTSGNLIDAEITLNGPGGSSTPIVAGIGLAHAVRPPLVLLYEFQVLAADGLTDRGGRPIRLGADEIRTAVKAAAAAQGSSTTILPDETSQQLSYVSYGEAMGWDERAHQWRASLDVKAFQFKTNTITGIVGRLAPYTVGDLAGFTVGQLGGL
jgi:hypothetical protein